MTGSGELAIVPEAVLHDLRRRHAEPHRRYHAWAHIEALLALFEERRDHLGDPDAVLLAILFHDAIYDLRAQDNEARSARLLEAADLPGVSVGTRARAVRMIEATAGHHIPNDAPAGDVGDLAEFLDMDLSILGAPDAVFDRYEADIRAEYAFVPEWEFRAGRRRILQGLLDRPRLYLSDWGRAAFEAQARANLARSVASLG